MVAKCCLLSTLSNLSLGEEPPISIDWGAECWVVLADMNAPLRREMCSSTAGHRKLIAGSVCTVVSLCRRNHAKAWRTEQFSERFVAHAPVFFYHALPPKTTRLSIPRGLFLSLACLWTVTGPFIIPVRAQTADEYKTLQNTASVSSCCIVLLCGLVGIGWWVGISSSSCYASVASAAENDTHYEIIYVCFI